MKKINIQKLERYSLSDSDIRRTLKPNKVNIIEYENLPKYSHIDDLFKGSNVNYCVLFIPENEKENSGHWTCIIKHKNGQYEYFDSYKDYPPDSEMKWLSKQLKNELHFDRPFLHDLFVHSGVSHITVNHYPFQSQKRGINTCGDHACSRLLHSDLTLEQYWNTIKKSKLSPDVYVTQFIHKLLGK